MTVRCFVDTNILIYAARAKHDSPGKFAIANRIIQDEPFCLSAQVLQEFFTAAQKGNSRERNTRPLSPAEAAEWVAWLEPFCEVAIDSFLVLEAIEVERRYKISYWDAAIIVAAHRAAASIVYTEDLSHEQYYGSVRVLNPFATR
jgi:predicted nucleic acid-binding protein